jgi:hypothetical protein
VKAKSIPSGRRLALLLASGLAWTHSQAQNAFFVAPSGNDGNSGTLARPFATMAQGQAAAQPGDTVYIRGGTYFHLSTAEFGVNLTKSGSPAKRIHFFAYPGEVPVFDFKGLIGGGHRVKGVMVRANWIHLKGLEMMGVPQDPAMRAHENWCINVNGSDNIFELLNLHHNMGPGLFITEGANNLVLNCDSHNNYDPHSYSGSTPAPGENADGFGYHGRRETGTGNVFRGCRAWWNADDGFDFIGSVTPVLVEGCWAFKNGYKAGTLEASGNGNGFKVGGYGLPADPPATIPRHTVRSSLAFGNLAAGFYQNHHPVSNFYYNNTSYNNRSANFNLLGHDMATLTGRGMGTYRNNIAYKGTALSNATGTGFDAANNSWNLPVTLTDADFRSVDTAGVAGPRRADGGLPDLPFMKPAAGSDLLDKGVDVGIPYIGAKPDLGAFEYGTGPVVAIRIAPRNGKAGPALSSVPRVLYDLSGRPIEPRSLPAGAVFRLPKSP